MVSPDVCRSASQQACEADSSSMSMSSCSQGQELRRQESSQSDTDDEDGGSLTQMSSLCPLWDTMLPLDAASLKGKQVRPSSAKSASGSMRTSLLRLVMSPKPNKQAERQAMPFRFGFDCNYFHTKDVVGSSQRLTISPLKVEHALRELQSQNVDKVMAALEVLARLAWSDDEVSVAAHVNRNLYHQFTSIKCF